jgi:deoxyribose-phosphate aldolase
MPMTAGELARKIDHTLLRPEATRADVDALCDEACAYGFRTVCVNATYVRRAAQRLSAGTRSGSADCTPVVCSVAGFPLGGALTSTKVDEARRAIDDGAVEIDMVADVGALVDGDGTRVRRDIAAVSDALHKACASGILKVILETSVLADDRIALGCRCCKDGRADFVKTSTGFHPAGGATIPHVRLLRRCAAGLRIKASGGIRTAETALAMIDAGADRIGTSSGTVIIDQLRRSLP